MKLKYAAQIENVCEVSLEGRADLDYWQQRLAAEGLTPASEEGRAKVTISASAMRYMGVPFRELIVGVAVEGVGEAGLGEPVFLVEAYNTNKFFAWVERTFFSAPYRLERIAVSLATVGIQLGAGKSPLLYSAMGHSRTPQEVISHNWKSLVHLPTPGSSSERKFFVAEISGETRSYPFDARQDRYVLAVSPLIARLQCLAHSHFQGTLWQVREAARHAKSKTYKRADLPALFG